MEQTARFAIPQLAAGQLQKEFTHNEALQRIDMLLCPIVEGAPGPTPPATPAIGSCYLVGAGATGAWAGQDAALACFTDGGWRFVQPREGMAVIDRVTGQSIAWRSGGWESGIARVTEVRVDGTRVLAGRQGAIADPGGGTVVDAECRAAVADILDRQRANGLIE